MIFPPEQMARLYDSVRAIHSTLEPEAALRLVVISVVIATVALVASEALARAMARRVRG